jgi:hypothetical protein
MKKPRLLAAGLPLGALAILAVAGAPAASAATHPATHVTVFAGQDMISPHTSPFCPTTNDEYSPARPTTLMPTTSASGTRPMAIRFCMPSPKLLRS